MFYNNNFNNNTDNINNLFADRVSVLKQKHQAIKHKILTSNGIVKQFVFIYSLFSLYNLI
jgi:hypothetical protein